MTCRLRLRSHSYAYWRFFLFLVSLLVFSILLHAGIITERGLSELVAGSDRVLIGKVLLVRIGGPEMTADVQILRTYRGPGKPGETICIRMPVDTGNWPYPSPATERPGIATMLFLKDGPGCALAVPRWTPPGSTHDYFWQVLEAPPPVGSDLTRGDIGLQLSAEALAAFPRLKAPTHPSMRPSFDEAMVMSVANLVRNGPDLARWVDLVRQPEFGAPAILSSVLQMANSDPAGMPAMIAELDQPRLSHFGHAAWGLLQQYYRSPDPDGIRMLGQTLENPAAPIFVRNMAVRTLLKISTAETVPYLLRATDSPQFREMAMMGLDRYVLGDKVTETKDLNHCGTILPRHKPSSEMIEELNRQPVGRDEQTMMARVKFWKEWGRRHGFGR
ncbi:MAG: hypothetical protein IH602_08190 [Bryobacteraceae bacterium]|nr:hypothetical protein [Bryobacteraceae bacterium]